MTNIPKNSNRDRGKALYGDMLNVVVGCVCCITYGVKLYHTKKDDPKRSTAVQVYAALVSPLLFVIPAAVTKNLWLSRLGMMTVALALAFMNLAEWPYTDVCEISLILQSQLFITVLTNVSLSFHEKLLRLGFYFLLGSYVSIQSPHSVYVEDALPILGGTVVLAMFALYVYHFGVGRQLATVQGSRLLLAALFVHHSFVDLTSSYAAPHKHLFSFLKALVLACLGVIATGTFREEIHQKEQLEILVKDRTKKIESQNKKLRMISMALKASETAIAITDRAGKIIWINPAFESMCQQTEDLLIDLPLKDVIYKLDLKRKENRYILFNTFEDPMNPSEDELLIGESIFQLQATSFQEGDEDHPEDDGSPNDRFLMVFKDVTAVRARELAEKKAQDKAMMAKAMGDAMVTLTHELRTPLQGIMGVTSLLLQQENILDCDMLESLKLIMASSSLLLNLINNLLDIKKVNSKMMEDFPMASIVASGPINDAVGFCRPLASISNVKIGTDLRIAKHAIVKSNALRLQQVLINLISNAIKYTKVGSEICVRIHPSTIREAEINAASALACSQTNKGHKIEDDDISGCGIVDEESSPVLVFSVSDCGPGIAPDQAGLLFHRYTQLDTKPSRTLGNNVGQPSGTGLGLNLCQLFVERMNGRIWATNNANNDGSTFSFYLPLVTIEDYDQIIGVPAACVTKRRKSISGGNRRRLSIMNDKTSLFELRVLLVDDVLINRKVFYRMLKEIGVSNSVTVESGEKALEELAINEYDLVITDLQMPGMSGTELSLAINSNYDNTASASIENNNQSPPIVIGLTANTGIDVVERCAASGMVDVLYKPLTLSEMKDYFQTTIPRLEPGVWYADAYDAQKERILAQ